MRIGVGLPATIPGATGRTVLDWAREADGGPFSCLGVLDRVLYDNYEPLTVLASAAAVTERVKLAACVVIGPLRATPLLGKQAATVQAISGGRLVLGLGLGAREDDYQALGVDMRTRGRRLTDQLVEMRRQWEGDVVGPRLAQRPLLLVGGGGGLAASRMARYADGFVHGGGPPRAFARGATEARAAWEDAGRLGKPELWGMAYFQLGGDPGAGAAYLKDYYSFTGPFAERIAAGILTDASEIDEFAREYAEAGCDELILYPTVPDPRQLAQLAAVVAGS